MRDKTLLISLLQKKGGSGKTTASIALASGIHEFFKTKKVVYLKW